MAEKKNVKEWCTKDNGKAAGAGAVYGLGFLGAVVYFIQNANGFWNGLIGILKAIVWPAFLIYELLKFLKM